MSAHTPGPWTADDSNVTSGRRNVAIAFDPDDHAHLTPVSKANARLIAAAPEMYQWLTAHFAIEEGPGRTDRPQYEELRRILAKVQP